MERDKVKEGQMWLLMIVIGWVVLWLCGCKGVEYVPVKEVRTVELQQNGMFGSKGFRGVDESTKVTIHDSVVVVVNQQGEEVRREEWHEKETDREYREKYEELLAMYESLRSEKTDSVPVPYHVERALTKWERTRIDWGGWAMLAVVVLSVVSSRGPLP
jgi:hypothetical protein